MDTVIIRRSLLQQAIKQYTDALVGRVFPEMDKLSVHAEVEEILSLYDFSVEERGYLSALVYLFVNPAIMYSSTVVKRNVGFVEWTVVIQHLNTFLRGLV